MKYLAVIPARCGSKGIKFKNIVEICGKPLIGYTIETALTLKDSSVIQDVVVSTDCKEIKDIACKFGAKVPLLRTKELSGDHAKSSDALLHMIHYLESQNLFYDAVITLQPTSPLRTSDDIQEAIGIYENYSGKSLISCYRDESLSDLVFYNFKNNQAVAWNEDHNKGKRRQDFEELYIRNGAIYITDISFLKMASLLISDTPLMSIMPKSRSINLDTEEDLEILRKLIGSRVS